MSRSESLLGGKSLQFGSIQRNLIQIQIRILDVFGGGSRSVPDAFVTKPFRYQKGRVRYYVTTSVPVHFGIRRYPVRYQYRFGTGSTSVPGLFRYQT